MKRGGRAERRRGEREEVRGGGDEASAFVFFKSLI